MEYFKALIIKFIMCLAVLWLVLGVFYDMAFGHVLTLSLILTAVAFLLGDLFILSRFENWGATISDFILAFAAIWFYSVYIANATFPVVTAAAISALILSIGEFFFHKYVDNHILHIQYDTKDSDDQMKMDDRNLQTEFGEEIEPSQEDENQSKQ